MKTDHFDFIKVSTLILLSIVTSLVQAQTIQPYTAVYTGEYKGLNIDVTQTLTQLSEGEYTFSSHAKNFMGSIERNSQFTFGENCYVIPISQSMKRSFFGVTKDERTEFNWVTKTANYVSKKKNRTADINQFYLDSMGYQVQLAIDLAAGKKDVEYQVIRRGRVKSYHFKVTQEENLTTNMGDIETIKVVRVREDKERYSEFWLAPSLNYLLVKLHQIDKGDDYNLILKELK